MNRLPSEQRLKLDLQFYYPNKNTNIRVSDKRSRKLFLEITDNTEPVDLTGYSIGYECIKPDGKLIRDTGEVFNNVEEVDLSKGKFNYTLIPQVATKQGEIITSYFVFTKGDERLTTRDFRINVFTDLTGDGTDNSESYITEIDILIDQLRQYVELQLDAFNIRFQEEAGFIQTILDNLNAQIRDIREILDTDILGRIDSISKRLDELKVIFDSLNVYSKDEIDSLIDSIVFDGANFVKHEEFDPVHVQVDNNTSDIASLKTKVDTNTGNITS